MLGQPGRVVGRNRQSGEEPLRRVVEGFWDHDQEMERGFLCLFVFVFN